MIAAAITALVMIAAGLGLARLIHPSARPLMLLGEAFLFGSGWAYFVLFAVSLTGFRWSLPPLAAAAVAPAALLLVRRGDRFPRSDLQSSRGDSIAAIALDSITALMLVSYAVLVTLAPMWEWDFWSIWGLKARVFLESGGIDWAFLLRPENLFSNPDYPLLLPLSFDAVSLAAGRWEPRWVGVLFPLFAAAFLLIARSALQEELGSRWRGAAATLALAGFAISPWIGLAEGPLIAFWASAIVLIRKGLREQRPDSLRAGAILAGLAAVTKNEGIAFAMIAVFAVVVHLGQRVRPKNERRLSFFGLTLWQALAMWPALAIAALWPLVRLAHGVRSYYLSSSTIPERMAARLMHPGELLRAMADFPPPKGLFWIAFAAALLLAYRSLKRETFLVTALLLQLLSYLAAYAATSHPLRWQIMESWDRLATQLGAPAMLLAIVVLFPIFSGVRELPEAPAGDDDDDRKDSRS